MNMCKNIHKSIASSLAAAALLLGSAGCNDFLNVVPDDGLPSIETAFNLRSSAIRYLATCYSYMTLEGSMGNDPAMLGSDEYWDLYGRTTTNTTGRVPFTMSYIARGNMTANSVFANDWADMYKGIRCCDIFVDNIGKVPDMDETEKAQWIAEVTFLKAYFHFNLVRKWDRSRLYARASLSTPLSMRFVSTATISMNASTLSLNFWTRRCLTFRSSIHRLMNMVASTRPSVPPSRPR